MPRGVAYNVLVEHGAAQDPHRAMLAREVAVLPNEWQRRKARRTAKQRARTRRWRRQGLIHRGNSRGPCGSGAFCQGQVERCREVSKCIRLNLYMKSRSLYVVKKIFYMLHVLLILCYIPGPQRSCEVSSKAHVEPFRKDKREGLQKELLAN